MPISVTSYISVVFLACILHSIYSFYTIFQIPKCNSDDICYRYYLNENPDLDLLVYLSDNSKSGDFDLVLHVGKFDYRESYEKEIEIELSNHVRHNGSLFIHTLLLPAKNTKYSINSIGNLLKLRDTTYVKGRLTQYAVPESDAFNLLKSKQTTNKEKQIRPVTHLRSNYAVRMCTDNLHIPHRDIPREIYRIFRVSMSNVFWPIMIEDSLAMRLKDLEPIESSNTLMKFKYIYNPSSLGKVRFLVQMDASLHEFLKLGFTEKDTEEVKMIFADTNVYLLCGTMAIAGVHLLLDFLSFKNDVSFWKNKTTMAGLSSRVVLWRAFSQSVIYLYLLDQQTSALVLVPSGIATVIEYWKVWKVFRTRAEITWTGIRHRKDIKESKEEEDTRKYDAESMRYLSWVLYPLCIGAAVYSLLYQPHKSWYSWTINSLANGVYAFGFLFMLPQLFINYRLKSVAALPWRSFMYRAFNTFIDDIFAFIITMPVAHRVACFRDDVIFLIYLYQRWLYPVDKSRTEGLNGEVSTTKDDVKSTTKKKKQ